MLLRIIAGPGRRFVQGITKFNTGLPPAHSAVFARHYSRKGGEDSEHDDPRILAAEEIYPEAELDDLDPSSKKNNISDYEYNIMPEHPSELYEKRSMDDDDWEVEELLETMEVQQPPLGDEWIFDREKESYFNPLTKEVKMPFWKSKADYQARRAVRYAKQTEEQERRPLPFYADENFDEHTQFYWEHEMARVRNRYNYLDFKELDKVLAQADTRFFSNDEDLNIIPWGPVLEDKVHQRGIAEAKAEEDKFNSFIIPIKYHVKDFTRTHSSAVGKKVGFGTLVIGGNRKGVAGYGYGKGKDLVESTRMAAKDLMKNLIDIPLDENRTIYQNTRSNYGTTKVILNRCKRGHGITAGKLIWALCDCLGIDDLSTKIYGSTHPLHVCYAFFRALVKTKSGRESALLRGRNYIRMHERGVRTLNPPTFEEVKKDEAKIRKYINQAQEQWQQRQSLSRNLVGEADNIRDHYAMDRSETEFQYDK